MQAFWDFVKSFYVLWQNVCKYVCVCIYEHAYMCVVKDLTEFTLMITKCYRHPLLQCSILIRRFFSADQLSSVEARSFLPSAVRSSFAISHSLPSGYPSSFLIRRPLYRKEKWSANMIDCSIWVITYLSASSCKFLRTSVDLCDKTFSSYSFSWRSIYTSLFENWISSLT